MKAYSKSRSKARDVEVHRDSWKNFCRILFCLLFAAICFCSCQKQPSDAGAETTTAPFESETAPVSERTVSLGYYSHYSLDPFKTTGKTNKNLLTLIYDPLFRLDSAYYPAPVVAEGFRADGKTLTVTIKDDVVFSDGTPLSAADVVYSFKLAKKSSLYSERLSNFNSAYANGGQVVFTLAVEDIFAVNCLDFPIVESASDDGDGLPVGSGRYALSKENGDYVLLANQRYSLEEKMEQEKIRLLDVNTTENALYLVQIGKLSFFFDDMSSDVEKSRINANLIRIGLNNLVFLGVNNESETLSDMNVRNAVAFAIDKQTVVGTAYDSLAEACPTAFNPEWVEAAALKVDPERQDLSKSRDLLEKSGYIYAYDDNEFRSKNFVFLELNLIASSEDSRRAQVARLIKSQLESVGISVKLETLGQEEYEKRLESGQFDLYVGETKLTPNMDLSVFFSKSGSANYTIDPKSTVASAYSDFISGKIDISTFVQVFDEYKPFIPLCYRSGVAYCSREIKYEGTVGENDVFANIYSWSFE